MEMTPPDDNFNPSSSVSASSTDEEPISRLKRGSKRGRPLNGDAVSRPQKSPRVVKSELKDETLQPVSEDDEPLTARQSALTTKKTSNAVSRSLKLPRTVKSEPQKQPLQPLSDDDEPLAVRQSVLTTKKAVVKSEATTVKTESKAGRKTKIKSEHKIEQSVVSVGRSGDSGQDQGYRWWDEEKGEEENKIKWTTLSHNAVMFPPDYEPHDVPLIYDGETIKLSHIAEEVATYYASKLGTDHVKSETFNRNFFEDFRNCLQKGWDEHKKIKKLELCDFSRIYDHLELKKAEKKDLPMAEKKKLREAEAERCKKYTVALVDGREEKVGNYRVEPPGLFLGRGEHPKRGKLKARIYPEDITINIGANDPIPECPMAGHKWGTIVHKQDVTWLCGWKDSITGGSKYVWLAAGSAFKGMSDHAKFEKARKLKDHIEKIRRDYWEGFKSKTKEVRQRSVAMYLIDKLALRVGNEKGEEEADTVGCCSLRVEHLQFEPPCTVIFDFLGKDSIRYFNSVQVEKSVFDNLKLFCRGKRPEEEVFHRLTVTGLNDHLKSLMDGLSAKVFRTFNASITLDDLLQSTPNRGDVNDKLVFYNQQNKEVAILCNHQRALPKQHEAQMEKMDKRTSETQNWLNELMKGRKTLLKKDDPSATVELEQWVREKPVFTDSMDDKARAAERKRAAEAPLIKVLRQKKLAQVDSAIKQVKQRLAKLKADMQVKEDLKTVALGTSKINYLDPRITVAWCKKHEVPIERIFAKTLLTKFAWAMEVSENYQF